MILILLSEMFTNICARWPGATHDSYILQNSQIGVALSERNEAIDGVLIGDSGYPLRPFLMTPFGNPIGATQRRYNRSLKSTRSIIERVIGQLKRRFHVLHSEVCKLYIHIFFISGFLHFLRNEIPGLFYGFSMTYYLFLYAAQNSNVLNL